MMDSHSPEQLRCGMGSMAVIVRGRAANIGKLVVVTGEYGYVTHSAPGSRSLLHWNVESLGGQLDVGGQPAWRCHTPDATLRPVGSMRPAQVQAVMREHHCMAFDAVAGELAKIINDHYATPDDAGLTGEKRMQREELNWLLDTVPAAQVLAEAGFEPDGNGGEGLKWTGQHRGVPIRFDAFADLLGDWCVSGCLRTSRTVSMVDVWLSADIVRGKVFERLAKVWRDALGNTPLPDEWERATTFADLKRTRAIANPGRPHMLVDTAFLRLAVSRLKAYNDASNPPQVALSMEPGQLEIRVADEVLHCPARGKWFGQATVSLSDLMQAIPPRFSRGQVAVEFSAPVVLIQGAPIAAIWSD